MQRAYDPSQFSLVKARLRLGDEERQERQSLIALALLLGLFGGSVAFFGNPVPPALASSLVLLAATVRYARRGQRRRRERREIDQGLAMLRERWREVPHG